jgi:sulfatase-modifying factor enzyme 1
VTRRRLALVLPVLLAAVSASCAKSDESAGDPDVAALVAELRDMAYIPGTRLEPLFGDGLRVDVQPFFVDRFETTNEEFARFVRSPGFSPASPQTLFGWARGPNGREVPRGREHHPVVDVTFADAAAYARFCGKRLPTEVEWRVAARKLSDSRYPWGQGFSTNRCNSLACGIGDTTIVGTFESGQNDWGCYDFAGNVAEMVDTSPPGSPGKLVLGGNFRSTAEECTIPNAASKRSLVDARIPVVLPTELQFDVGFRCVRDVAPELLDRIQRAWRIGDADAKEVLGPILRAALPAEYGDTDSRTTASR